MADEKAAEKKTKQRKKGGGAPEVGASQGRLSRSHGHLHLKTKPKAKPAAGVGEDDNPRGSGGSQEQGSGVFPFGELPPKLMPLDDMPPGARINTYSKIDYLREINMILRDTPQWEWLMDSMFGKLFALPTRYCEFSARLVHNMFCRSLVTEKKHEMWFQFGGKPIRYSLREFAMITGMNCNPLPSKKQRKALRKVPEGEDSMWKTLFGTLEEISIQDVVRMLTRDMAEKRPSHKMSNEHKLQMCLVVIVDGILINNSSTICASKKTVEMVRDIDKFCDYPWGRKSFTRTLRMVTVGKRVTDPETLASKFHQSHISVYGLSMAFQLLFIYAVPSLEKIIPKSKTDSFWSNPKFTGLTKAHPFHNKNIMKAEADPELYVDSILSSGHSPDDWDLTWPDEVDDDRVAAIHRALNAQYSFTPQDWKLYQMRGRGGPRRMRAAKPKRKFEGFGDMEGQGLLYQELLSVIEQINEYHDEKKFEALERIDAERNEEIRKLFIEVYGASGNEVGEDEDIQEQPVPARTPKRKVRGESDNEDLGTVGDRGAGAQETGGNKKKKKKDKKRTAKVCLVFAFMLYSELY